MAGWLLNREDGLSWQSRVGVGIGSVKSVKSVKSEVSMYDV